MKKTNSVLLAYIVCFPIFFLSCYQEAPLIDNIPKPEFSSHHIDYDQALQTALSFLKDESKLTRSESQVSNHYEYFVQSATRSSANSVDVGFHVINFGNDAGYALVANDDRATPIYAFADEGHLDMDEALKNPGFQIFMDGAISRFTREIIGSSGLVPIIPMPDDSLGATVTIYDGNFRYVRTDVIRDTVECTVPTLWHQDMPYNMYCPWDLKNGNYVHCLAGCVAIATAQIMTYHRKPLSYNGYTIDWESISHFVPASQTDTIRYAAQTTANYIYQIALSCEMDFGVSASYSNITKAKNAFVNWGYHVIGPVYFNTQLVTNSIDVSRPVFCVGQNSEGNTHAWVIDGYRRYGTRTTYWNAWPPFDLYKIETSEGYYYHCNWGWGCSSYCLDTFDSRNGSQYSQYNGILYSIYYQQ